MLSLEVVKVIVLFVLLTLTFILGIIPIKVIRIARNRTSSRLLTNLVGERSHVARPVYKRVISFLSCFAAGVFLATCFLDLLPDVRRQLTNVLDVMKIYTGFPVAEFVMSLGLFAILITEQVVLTMKENNSRQGDRKPLLNNDDDWNKSTDSSGHGIAGISDRPQPHWHQESSATESSDIESHRSEENSISQVKGETHLDSEISEEQPHSPLRAFLLLIALSLHSVFEGLAVGLQTKTGDVLGIFAALVLHKSILSFSLGMNMVQTTLSSSVMIRSIFLFSVTAPVGIGIGIGIIDLWDSTTSSLVQGLLQGIACGTFLYITFFEVLSHEFNSHHDRILKLLFLLLGFSTVTGILFLNDSIRKPFCPVHVPTNSTGGE